MRETPSRTVLGRKSHYVPTRLNILYPDPTHEQRSSLNTCTTRKILRGMTQRCCTIRTRITSSRYFIIIAITTPNTYSEFCTWTTLHLFRNNFSCCPEQQFLHNGISVDASKYSKPCRSFGIWWPATYLWISILWKTYYPRTYLLVYLRIKRLPFILT